MREGRFLKADVAAWLFSCPCLCRDLRPTSIRNSCEPVLGSVHTEVHQAGRRRHLHIDLAIVTASIREVATLDEQIAQVERKIRQHFDDHPDLKRRRDLLTSIPGIGETAAGSIL
jgi:transposase